MAYQTVTAADLYFNNRLHVYSWTSSNESEKTKALEEATARMDRLQFTGYKTDETQDNEFPRDDETDVPDDIKIACCEIAFALLDGIDPEKEYQSLAYLREGFASEQLVYDKTAVPEHTVAGIPSAYAWRYLLPYLDRAAPITLNRTS